MMKMATEEGLPPPAGCRNGSRLVFGGSGGLRRRSSRSRFISGSLGIYERYWRRKQVPDWFLVAIEACGDGNPDLGSVLEVWGYIRGVGVENK